MLLDVAALPLDAEEATMGGVIRESAVLVATGADCSAEAPFCTALLCSSVSPEKARAKRALFATFWCSSHRKGCPFQARRAVVIGAASGRRNVAVDCAEHAGPGPHCGRGHGGVLDERLQVLRYARLDVAHVRQDVRVLDAALIYHLVGDGRRHVLAEYLEEQEGVLLVGQELDEGFCDRRIVLDIGDPPLVHAALGHLEDVAVAVEHHVDQLVQRRLRSARAEIVGRGALDQLLLDDIGYYWENMQILICDLQNGTFAIGETSRS